MHRTLHTTGDARFHNALPQPEVLVESEPVTMRRSGARKLKEKLNALAGDATAQLGAAVKHLLANKAGMQRKEAVVSLDAAELLTLLMASVRLRHSDVEEDGAVSEAIDALVRIANKLYRHRLPDSSCVL